jgi:UDP-2,3-diacylglucosamine pyrophosphatase LpxH
MLIFVSDLHLADSPQNSVADVAALVKRVRELVADATSKGTDGIILVLLGDIFELLKSERWVSNGVRPWDQTSLAHATTVNSIFEAVWDCNKNFFSGLEELRSEYKNLRFTYVPGNHDRVLNTEMGATARRTFRRVLSVQGNDVETFLDTFADTRHKVIAKHGHQWDPQNRYTDRGVAVGDAVVIELLVKLPSLIRTRLHLAVDDPLYQAMLEIDNVRPQSPRSMAQWLISHLGRLNPNAYSNPQKVLEECFREVVREFQALRSEIEFESFDTASWWEKFLQGAASKCLELFGVVATSLALPDGGESVGPYSDFASSDLRAAAAEADYRYMLCGHTHIPEIAPLGPSGKSVSPLMYLNTGAWRRVHRPTKSRDQPWAFASWNESCLVTICNPDEQRRGFAAYEFHRAIRA